VKAPSLITVATLSLLELVDEKDMPSKSLLISERARSSSDDVDDVVDTAYPEDDEDDEDEDDEDRGVLRIDELRPIVCGSGLDTTGGAGTLFVRGIGLVWNMPGSRSSATT